ncbi:hypothetical protein Taro_032597 [Colocasia esculenta]|uniref:Uncharacterized protein n=1 Tax=Colocasia esculenta TaxID=4460 RepID=A0A843W6J7_COLES|nr:hypothetical protein [Colocasia esculenta]
MGAAEEATGVGGAMGAPEEEEEEIAESMDLGDSAPASGSAVLSAAKAVAVVSGLGLSAGEAIWLEAALLRRRGFTPSPNCGGCVLWSKNEYTHIRGKPFLIWEQMDLICSNNMANGHLASSFMDQEDSHPPSQSYQQDVGDDYEIDLDLNMSGIGLEDDALNSVTQQPHVQTNDVNDEATSHSKDIPCASTSSRKRKCNSQVNVEVFDRRGEQEVERFGAAGVLPALTAASMGSPGATLPCPPSRPAWGGLSPSLVGAPTSSAHHADSSAPGHVGCMRSINADDGPSASNIDAALPPQKTFAQILMASVTPPSLPIKIHSPACTDSGEPAVFFSPDEVRLSCEPLKHAIIARTPVGRPSFQEIRLHLAQRFGFAKEFIIIALDGRHLLL